jgi:methylated-DNA-[protein]-cysteine S-methyltransferase
MNIVLPDRPFFAVFQTRWGYFGLAGRPNALLRTILPTPSEKTAKKLLLNELENALPDKKFCQQLQQKIQAYFEGCPVDFNDIVININQFNHFTKRVLTACRSITFSKTTSYGQLAGQIGNRLAARAVGRALAQNPLPLIIPCHRVIRSDNLLGGFSAKGGKKLKARLLELESNCSAEPRPSGRG